MKKQWAQKQAELFAERGRVTWQIEVGRKQLERIDRDLEALELTVELLPEEPPKA